MSEVVRIGLDTAKLVFELHGVDVHGSVVLRRTVRRKDLLATFAQLPRCLVGLESCAGSHHWARALQMLGHDARLMASQFVSAYRKEQKNDANDAADCAKLWVGPKCVSYPLNQSSSRPF